MGLNLTKKYSTNFGLPKRLKKSIKFIIIHYTGMQNQLAAIKKLGDSKSRVSTHYFIKNNGKILNMVPDLYEAWHAGQSEWKTYKSLNKHSIGIEINNPGHDNKYKRFNNNQINNLKKLLIQLIKNYNINTRNILGHSDIAPNRKKDPGEKFPWKDLAKKNLCFWHKLKERKIKIFRKQKLSIKEEAYFIKNLYKIGYSKNFGDKKILTKAFQRRFRQHLVDGKVDKECFLISKSLLKQ
tara:strand:- start:115 stop:831 length:717 start_codon:yes stop_codon:yes gene_type:complete